LGPGQETQELVEEREEDDCIWNFQSGQNSRLLEKLFLGYVVLTHMVCKNDIAESDLHRDDNADIVSNGI